MATQEQFREMQERLARIGVTVGEVKGTGVLIPAEEWAFFDQLLTKVLADGEKMAQLLVAQAQLLSESAVAIDQLRTRALTLAERGGTNVREPAVSQGPKKAARAKANPKAKAKRG